MPNDLPQWAASLMGVEGWEDAVGNGCRIKRVVPIPGDHDTLYLSIWHCPACSTLSGSMFCPTCGTQTSRCEVGIAAYGQPFSWALNRVKHGDTVRRRKWVESCGECGMNENGFYGEKECPRLMPSDFEATDWELVKKP